MSRFDGDLEQSYVVAITESGRPRVVGRHEHNSIKAAARCQKPMDKELGPAMLERLGWDWSKAAIRHDFNDRPVA